LNQLTPLTVSIKLRVYVAILVGYFLALESVCERGFVALSLAQ